MRPTRERDDAPAKHLRCPECDCIRRRTRLAALERLYREAKACQPGWPTAADALIDEVAKWDAPEDKKP